MLNDGRVHCADMFALDGCAPEWVEDGECDETCNVAECNYDGADCPGPSARRLPPSPPPSLGLMLPLPLSSAS